VQTSAMKTLSLLGCFVAPTALVVAASLFACGAPRKAETANEVELAKTDETAPTPPPAATPAGRSKNTYDKDGTEVALKRAARAVKDSCGDARDESGVATGPWGKLTIQVVLGHAGRVKEVTVPASHADKPAGRCISNAFSGLIFPPWAGEDTPIDWEVELVQPAAPAPATSGSAKPGKK
jgi:pyruvate/2-oxoglutarate dehydrogenase complex dihydrolipoamide acyltransferase (E2) component